MPKASENGEPGGLRSTHDAALPLQRLARLTVPKTAHPTCCVPEVPQASEFVDPAGLRSTHEAALPLQRLARCTPPTKARPTCCVPKVRQTCDESDPAGLKSTHESALPPQRLARITLPTVTRPACCVPVVPRISEYVAPAGCRFVTVHDARASARPERQRRHTRNAPAPACSHDHQCLHGSIRILWVSTMGLPAERTAPLWGSHPLQPNVHHLRYSHKGVMNLRREKDRPEQLLDRAIGLTRNG